MNYNTTQKNMFLKKIYYVAILLILCFPLLHVSAKNNPYQENREVVLFGTVMYIDTTESFLILQVGSSTVMTSYTSTIELYTGNEEKVSLSLLQTGMRLYVFGFQENATTTYNNESIPLMPTEKIIIRNKSKLTRR
jgi:hypothetical protein